MAAVLILHPLEPPVVPSFVLEWGGGKGREGEVENPHTAGHIE